MHLWGIGWTKWNQGYARRWIPSPFLGPAPPARCQRALSTTQKATAHPNPPAPHADTRHPGTETDEDRPLRAPQNRSPTRKCSGHAATANPHRGVLVVRTATGPRGCPVVCCATRCILRRKHGQPHPVRRPASAESRSKRGPSGAHRGATRWPVLWVCAILVRAEDASSY